VAAAGAGTALGVVVGWVALPLSAAGFITEKERVASRLVSFWVER
jgi:hypothetical protein